MCIPRLELRAVRELHARHAAPSYLYNVTTVRNCAHTRRFNPQHLPQPNMQRFDEPSPADCRDWTSAHMHVCALVHV